MKDIFKSNSGYTQSLNPVAEAVKQMAFFISKSKNISIEKATERVNIMLNTNSKKRDPLVEYWTRDKNGDKYLTTTPLTEYLKTIVEKNYTITPTFTCFYSPEEKDSVHKGYTLKNVAKRKINKKKAAVYEMEKNMSAYSFYYSLQDSNKRANNSLSGALASTGTVLNNQSGHSVLTSITRSVASIGNSVSEMMVVGNRHYSKPSIIMNHMTAILTNVDMYLIENVVKKYGFKIPTVDEIMNMVTYSSDLYWRGYGPLNKIRAYVETFNDIERCAVMYVNDMYQMRLLNDRIMRDFLGKLHQKVIHGSNNNIDTLANAPEIVRNLVHHICMEELTGLPIIYDKMRKLACVPTLVGTTENVIAVLENYSDLIQAFFITKVMPIDIVDIGDMTRRGIVLSDTDSTVCTTGNVIEWYYGKNVFSEEATALSAAIITVVAGTIEHYLRQLNVNMNTSPEHHNMLAMKNEFYWDVFVNAFMSKHYFANTRIKEGSVYDIPKLEVKGVNLLAGKTTKEIKKLSKELMIEINRKISNNELLNLGSYVTYVADLERDIFRQLDTVGGNVYQIESIKDAKSYKNGINNPTYFSHLLWENVFSEKYGSPGEPPYLTYKINTTLSTKSNIKNYIEKIENHNIKEQLQKMLETKDKFEIMRVPIQIFNKSGIPEEIAMVRNNELIVSNLLSPIYSVLETIGFFRKTKMLYTDLGY